MALVMWALPLSVLTLPLLWRAPGAGAQVGQGFSLQQPQDKVSVSAGQTLNLTCTTSGRDPLGPMKWLKGWGSGNETIYEQTGSFPRVTRAVIGSDTDFSIRIRDVQPEDAGTYYCVKFQRSVDGVVVFQRGKGTEVSVGAQGAPLPSAKPTHPVVSGPNSRAEPEQSVPFNCTSGGFFPKDPHDPTGVNLLSSPGLWLGILLEKGLLGGLLIFLFRRGRA